MAIKINGNTVIFDDRTAVIGTGRPVSPENGMFTFNTELGYYEIYNNGQWVPFIGSGIDYEIPSTTIVYSYKTISSEYVKLDGSILLQNTYPSIYTAIGLQPNNPTWTVRESGTTTAINALTFGNGLFVYARSGTGQTFGTSTDAINWTTRSAGTGLSTNNNLLIFGNGLYIATGSRYQTSTNGINWTLRFTPLEDDFTALTFGNSLFVGAGKLQENEDPSSTIVTSTDGINWTVRTSGTTSSIVALTYGDGLYVYGGVDGILGTSTNGIDWTVRTSGTTTTINALTFGNGLFVRGGNGGQLGTSTDGINWTTKTSGTTTTINTLIYADGLYVYGGFAGTLGTSIDGINWTTRTSGTTTMINALTFGNGLYVYGGLGGSLGTNPYFTYNKSTEFVLPSIKINGVFNEGSSYIDPLTIYDGYIKE